MPSRLAVLCDPDGQVEGARRRESAEGAEAARLPPPNYRQDLVGLGRVSLFVGIADDFEGRLTADNDLLRAHGIWDFPDQVDHQESVREVGMLNPDEVRQFKDYLYRIQRNVAHHHPARYGKGIGLEE